MLDEADSVPLRADIPCLRASAYPAGQLPVRSLIASPQPRTRSPEPPQAASTGFACPEHGFPVLSIGP